MNTTTPDPRAVLTVPWLVAETVPAPIVPAVPTPAQPLELHTPAQPGVTRNPRPFYVSLAASVAWCILVAGLVLTGAMLPLEGNVLAYVVIMTWLFLACFTALTCPREEKPETFWTWGSEPVGQCTPSRNTLTGGRQ